MCINDHDISMLLPFLEHHGIEVLDQASGFIECVGPHTTPNRPKDCKVFMNPGGVPTIYCFHSSCQAEVRRLNGELAAWHRRRRHWRSPMREGTRKQRHSGDFTDQQLRQKAQEDLPTILRDYWWPYSSICADSPVSVLNDYPQHSYLLTLFSDDDIVWIGKDVYESGTPRHRLRFRTAIEWMREPRCPGSFVCPSAFKPGAYSRSDANVLVPRYLVVESDVLDRNQIGAVFRWLEKVAHINLRAVVDTAGKSLHGWFQYPNPKLFEKLKVILPAMGCDSALFKPSQPCRLPGALRAGKYQSLIYMTL